LVDDSGLTILALDGKPGIFSKRVKDGSDLERNLHILKSLKDIPQDKRQAAFVCALTFYDLEKQIVIQTQGIVAGRIASKIAGEEGFGYDSIFIPDGYQETFAQLGTKEKNKFSHRANATFSMRPFLQQWSHEN
jgi:XTP/dITP diphosphohydrolase